MKLKDDYNWDTYTSNSYERQLLNFEHDAIIKDFFFDNNEIVFNDNLHPNHKELYHQIHELNIDSVYECGFGCGHHLINIYNINNNIDINGCDYSKNQLDIGVKYFNINKYAFFNKLQIKDFSLPMFGDVLIKYDFVYTQAVTMHLAYDKAKKFLNNMKLISNKYVFLIENLNEHDYDNMIKEIFPYYRRVNTSKYITDGILLIKNNL